MLFLYNDYPECVIFCVLDVIKHVVERDVLKDKDINGKKSKLLDITLQDSEYVSVNTMN